ncbi:hypothetical protein WUBG_09150 [Wuchereria bancrofti]|uniref:Uncharacterized protein n=1 Tax=Wuchereria bancrofti TaxID=6293 RepID=J9AZ97_WUCBA|nr:hypothetical protein WUBG_09150 [Wuchereria bancrofti]
MGVSTSEATTETEMTGSPYSPLVAGRLTKLTATIAGSAATALWNNGYIVVKSVGFGGVDCYLPFTGSGLKTAPALNPNVIVSVDCDLKVSIGVVIRAYVKHETADTPITFEAQLFDIKIQAIEWHPSYRSCHAKVEIVKGNKGFSEILAGSTVEIDITPTQFAKMPFQDIIVLHEFTLYGEWTLAFHAYGVPAGTRLRTAVGAAASISFTVPAVTRWYLYSIQAMRTQLATLVITINDGTNEILRLDDRAAGVTTVNIPQFENGNLLAATALIGGLPLKAGWKITCTYGANQDANAYVSIIYIEVGSGDQ